MRKFVTVFSIGLIFSIYFSFPDSGFATDFKNNPAKMQQDLDVLKTILDKLMEPECGTGLGTHIWPNFGTRAIYIDEYGVIFTYQCQSLPTLSKNKDTETRPETAGGNRTENIRQILVEFLGNYGDALGQLQPDNYISVIIQPRENPLRHVIRDMKIFTKSTQLDQIMATVSKKTIDDYHRKKLAKNKFAAKIEFHRIDKDDDRHREIEIMSRIFDTALRNNKNCSLSLRGKTWGEYITNFGILFMLRATNGLKVDKFHFTGDNFDNAGSEVSRKRPSPLDETTDMQQTKTVLVQLLADYGHTLRHVKPKEWIGINIELDNFDDQHSYLFLKVKSADIQDFHQNRISLKTFTGKIIFSKF